MATSEPKVKKDGQLVCLGGVDSSVDPSLIEPNSLAFAVNATMRGGFPATRPRLSKKTLQFNDNDTQEAFEEAMLQGYTRTAYRSPSGKALIGVSVGGRIFIISPEDDFTVTDITPDAGNIPTEPLAWFEQAEQYLVIQNNRDGAIIYDGTAARRAAATGEVPSGSAMVYNEEIGRLCVAVNDREIAIGDIVGGPTEVIQFTENTYLSEGGKFKVPMKYGKITGMSMIANLDRANGQGAMLVFAEEGITAFNLPPNRASWKDLTYPPQINMPIRYSATGQNSIVLVNGDVYYRASDGLRSFVYAVREFQGLGNVPMSTELRRVTDRDSEDLLDRASTILFDNRILFTVNPGRGNGIYHRGIGALDLDLISRLKQKLPPAYDGIWTGIRPTGMMTGKFAKQERAFIFALNPDTNTNELWELHKEMGYDNTESRISGVIETRAFNFGNPLEAKKLLGLEIWVDEAFGQVNIGAQFRPDNFPCWVSWACAKDFCVATEDCSTEDELSCKPLVTFNPGYRSRLNFGQPPESCEELDRKPANIGYTFQFRIYWTGQVRIKRILARVNEVQEQVFPAV